MVYKILRHVIDGIVSTAKNVYPDEFIALLGGDKETQEIDELVVLPAQFGKNYSSIIGYIMPIDSRVLGSVHSHPSRHGKPSRGDLRSFAKFGEVHLIISYPFNIGTIRAFDINGTELKLEVVENDE